MQKNTKLLYWNESYLKEMGDIYKKYLKPLDFLFKMLYIKTIQKEILVTKLFISYFWRKSFQSEALSS